LFEDHRDDPFCWMPRMQNFRKRGRIYKNLGLVLIWLRVVLFDTASFSKI